MKHTAYEETLFLHRFARWMKTARLATILLLVLALTSCNRTPPTAVEPVPTPVPTPVADDRLVYCLVLQGRALARFSLVSSSASDIKNYREHASRTLALLKVDAALSRAKLPELYTEVVRLNDARSAYLTELAQLSRSIEQRDTADNNAAVIKGLFDAAKEGSSKKDENEGGLEQFLKSTATGALSYYEEKERLDKIREQDKQGRLTACETKYEHAKSDFTASMEALAGIFTKTLKLPRSELGLDTALTSLASYKLQTPKQIADGLQNSVKERPRDPLVRASLLVNSSSKVRNSLDACTRLAEECNALAETVPDEDALRFMRYVILTDAATILDEYFYAAHPFEKPWGAIGNDKALIAASYRKRAADAYRDETGQDTVWLAWDYFFAGEFDSALKQAQAASLNPLFQKDWTFCLKMAQLKSLVGKTEDSMAWLTTLVERFQFNDIYALYSDPDLASLRKAKPEPFDALLTVHYSWDIDFGWVNDDILLTNKSPFPITGVRFKVHIISGDKEWNLDLKTEQIGPGIIYKWEDALSVPGSKISSRSATLICEQVHSPLRTPTLPKIK